MSIRVLSITDVHKITIFRRKYSCYVTAGGPGHGKVQAWLRRAIKMDKMSGLDRNFLSRAHL